jgi:Tol biopolymer transport system component
VLEEGLQVVYTHENNLWLWQTDGTQTQLTDSYDAFAPKISPDGKLVAYLKGWDIYNAELWVMNIDGSGNRQLVGTDHLAALPRETEAVGTMIGDFVWVPSSHTLAYNTIQLFEVPSSPQNNDLRLVNADNGKQTLLLEPGLGGKFTYAPDGSQIALVTPVSLSIINADGSNRRDILTFPVIFTNGGWNLYPHPVWAPDSGHLRVAIPPQDALNNPQAFTFIWHIPADGSMPHMAGEFVSIPAYVSAPLISPDTLKVIFLAAAGEAFDQLELRFLDLTDGSQTALYAGNISLHNWNPDSVRFVFTQDFGADFYLGQMDTPPDNIADVPVNRNLAWLSVDQFIFTSGDYENWELRIGARNMPSAIIAQPFGESFSFDFHPKP